MCILGAFIFALFGVFMFPWMLWSRARVEAMTTWPLAEAEVIETGIQSRYRRGAGASYLHTVTYRFVAGNQGFIGDRVSYGGAPPQWNSDAGARSSLPAIGSKLQVRYDPRDTSDSVIRVIRVSDADELHLRWFAGGVGAAGGILMVVAGMAWHTGKR